MKRHWQQIALAMYMVLLIGMTSAAQVELTLLHFWDGDRLDLVQHVLDDFMAANPDIVVKQMPSPFEGHADRLMTLLLGGAAPEVIMVNSALATRISAMGGLMPLDDFIVRDGIDLGMYIDPDLTGFQLHGLTYALPAMSGIAWTNLMFYNKDIMALTGLNPDAPPTTWSEWKDQSVRMVRRSADGNILQGGSFIPGGLHAAAWNGTLLWSDDWRKATVNTPRVEETLLFLRDLLLAQYTGSEEYLSFWGSGFSTAFYRGQMGFWFQNSAGFAHLKLLDIDFEWGAALAPYNELHDDTAPMGLVTSTWAYGIPSFIAPEKLEAAWRLVKWLTTEEDGAGWFARIQGRPSPVMSFNTHPDYVYENPYWHVVMESAQYVAPTPPVNLSVVSTPFLQVVRAGRNPQDGLDEAERLLQNELNEYWTAVQ